MTSLIIPQNPAFLGWAFVYIAFYQVQLKSRFYKTVEDKNTIEIMESFRM